MGVFKIRRREYAAYKTEGVSSPLMLVGTPEEASQSWDITCHEHM